MTCSDSALQIYFKMGLGEDIAVKKRKVVWDDYTGGFYAESKVEALQRLCDYRAKLTDVINKNEATRCRNAIRQVNAEKQMFLLRKEREAQKHNETWQDHKAHLNVLERLAKEREKIFESEVDNYGRYPPGSLRSDLDSMVESELREMSPVVQRKREASRLLEKRTEISMIDRTKTTEDVFDELKKRKSRAPSPAKTPAFKSKSAPKLILPAITVKLNTSADRIKMVEPVSQVKKQNINESNNSKTGRDTNLPSVFVTQFK